MSLCPITLCEYEEAPLRYDRTELVAAAKVPAETLVRILEPLVSLRPSLSDGKVAIAAGSQIGTIQVGGLRVDVRPRLAAAELATLIRYAYGSDVAWERSQIGLGPVGLDELLCIILADELSAIRQRGLSRQYVNRTEKLEVLRGRPDFLASFPWNDRGMTGISCRFHELTCDNLDNQLLRAGLTRAVLMQTSIPTRQRLLEHLQVWTTIASAAEPSPADFVTARVRYTRLSNHYQLAHRICEVLLAAQRPSAIYGESATTTAGLCMDMAELFELFVTRFLKQHLAGRGLAVREQLSDREAFLDGAGEVYRRVRPDLVVFSGRTPIAVLDAKYKDYWKAENADRQPLKRISNEDLYQLFFYAERLRNQHGLKQAPQAFIVCPLPASDERQGRAVLSDRYQSVRWQAGSYGGSVHVILLPLTDLLRQLRNSRPVDAGDLFPYLRNIAQRGSAAAISTSTTSTVA